MFRRLVREGAAFALLASIWPVATAAAVITPPAAASQTFSLADPQGALPIVIDDEEAPVVAIAARMLSKDVQSVSGQKPQVVGSLPAGGSVVVAGTLGTSKLVDDLVSRRLVDPAGVAGVWESYRTFVVKNPWPNVDQALVVVGADKRGTAYGTLSLSRALGVSPWEWWADVPAPRRETASISVPAGLQAPSVQYRGIFINDEDWSLRQWSETNFDKERGNIGPKTYERVFSLMLRLRANTLWPAMHPGTLAFNQDPKNAELADRYGIVMSASHAEPMLRNNVAEWDEGLWGAFDFATNREVVTDYWRKRVAANGRFENLYTVGMRGIHDTPVQAGEKIDRVKLLEDVVSTQRELLSRYADPDPSKVPQIFVPYKEVLDIYRRGMTLPEDVTLTWVDDNFGYIRQLSTPAEQKRAGGGGVYYHVSYWGWPTSYLWLSTTPPALIASEMGRAWDTASRRFWIVNVGDIKPGEVDAEYFLDLAWDYQSVSRLTQAEYLTGWAGKTFGQAHAEEIGGILDESFRLAFLRKPEHMDFSHDDVGVQPTEFSPVSYGDEAAIRLADYERLLDRANRLETDLQPEQRDAYYQLVQYPIIGARWMAEKALMADRSYLAAWQGRASAHHYAARSQQALARIQQATARYNAIGAGKWQNFMDDDPRDQAIFAGLPTGSAIPNTKPGLGIAVEGSVDSLANAPATPRADYADRVSRWRTDGVKADQLPPFSRATRRPHFIDLFNTGGGQLRYRLEAPAWIKLSKRQGVLQQDKRIWVNVDWSQVPPGVTGTTLQLSSGTDIYNVNIVLDRGVIGVEPGDHVAVDGVVAIEAENFVEQASVGESRWIVKPALGRSGAAIEAAASTLSQPDTQGAPYVEYVFKAARAGPATLTLAALPTFPLDRERELRYAVSIDGAAPQIVDIDADRKWERDVVRNALYSSTQWQLSKRLEHRIRLWALDPALVIDRLVLDLGGLRISYLGPPETKVSEREAPQPY